MDDIDDDVESVNRWEVRQTSPSEPEATGQPKSSKASIGSVDRFFDKIGVAAIKLTGRLSVGDIVEIGNEEEAVRQRVISMQINGENVEEAQEGDDVGIKLNYKVVVGSEVYRIEDGKSLQLL